MEQKLLLLIAKELKLKENQIKGTVNLLDEGNTVPFIARYRKEITGNLDEMQIRKIEERITYLRNLEERKSEVIRLIAEQDKLTSELEEKIVNSNILQEVEDLYRPFKKKRQTRGTKAKAKELEPLAQLIWEQKIMSGDITEFAQSFINPKFELEQIEEVYQGARDIIAEWISDDAEIRKEVRQISFKDGIIVSKCKDDNLDEKGKYELYYDFSEPVKKLPPHRILALNRGEKDKVLRVKVNAPEEEICKLIKNRVIKNNNSVFYDQLIISLQDAYKRLIAPSIEREIRNSLTDRAEIHAISVFSRNLKALLLQPPLKGHVVMGIDPGFRTGSKVCVVDQTGKLLATETIYPHSPQEKVVEAEKIIRKLITDYQVNSIAIGNGTASRETECFISNIIKDCQEDVNYTIVSEAGASVYSASSIAREEFPELDVSMRGAVSIARRLQDPLAELVKIEPRSIGVGLYQHDVDAKRLDISLEKVVESAVNYVGVDLNTASPVLLQYVSGITKNVAKNIVKYREENGSFKTRKELKKVYRLGEKIFTQAAGFLRIVKGDDPLDNTPIHPECYLSTKRLLAEMNFTVIDIMSKERLGKLRAELNRLDIEAKAERLEIGVLTLIDIISALKQPGRDPRDGLPRPLFRKDVLKLEDLKPDMILQGTVRNVVDFGAFVDIGVKEDGLVHISELSTDYVEDPLDIVQVGDVVSVKILVVDERRKRISLSMKC